jgi:hypothetical protein
MLYGTNYYGEVATSVAISAALGVSRLSRYSFLRQQSRLGRLLRVTGPNCFGILVRNLDQTFPLVSKGNPN